MGLPLSGPEAPLFASSLVSPESAARDFLHSLVAGSKVLVAYSGGSDSTGLLVALADCLANDLRLDIHLAAATVDHGLRANSAEEAREAGILCARLGIAHSILTWSGEKPGAGIQAAAREARYGLLLDHATDIGADLIVTAHTRDDQRETLAMRRLRSSASVTGMANAVLIGGRVWTMRPFLGVARLDIRSMLGRKAVGWVEDPSNDNEAFERVRVRKALAASPADVDPVGSFPDRRLTGQAVADRLRASATIESFRLATFDLGGWQTGDAIALAAILHLAAVIGGRVHLASRETAARLSDFLDQGRDGRMTAERVVFELRREKLYLVRERRGLPTLTIGAGETRVWDQRFRISNRSDRPAIISSRRMAAQGWPLLKAELSDDLPKAVCRRILETEPVVEETSSDGVTLEPILANYDRFLPVDMLEIANVLAFLGGLPHFPKLPTR